MNSNILTSPSLFTMVHFTSWALAFAACLPAVLAHPANGPRASQFGCGTAPTDDFVAKTKQLAALELNSAGIHSKLAGNSSATLTIDTYFHVVAKSTVVSGGYIPQASLTRQLAVMNENYGTVHMTSTLWQAADTK
jgi:hypothetical protein